jgi:hypothetical protein
MSEVASVQAGLYKAAILTRSLERSCTSNSSAIHFALAARRCRKPGCSILDGRLPMPSGKKKKQRKKEVKVGGKHNRCSDAGTTIGLQGSTKIGLQAVTLGALRACQQSRPITLFLFCMAMMSCAGAEKKP